MPSSDLRFRQIHLDFHTSPDIPGVGADFDPDRFADTLAKAHVDSVTCFARCHHGYIYYPTKKHPERIHPRLVRKNLLGEQIKACHQRNIRVPIYTTVQWDEFTADAHRDWLKIDADGREFSTRPLEPGFYRFLDVFHPGYRQFLFDHVQDIFETFGDAVDGFFFDIVQPQPSLAAHWLDAMDAAGVDPESEDARIRFALQVIHDWKRQMTRFIRRFSKDCTIFYNAGHVGPRHRAVIDAYSHLELESLPSGGWGYLHFPLTQRYARGLAPNRLHQLGMTGKFHTSWGDFQSYKNEAALSFECLQMIALGARCSIGDQLPPGGQLDHATYELIGRVYARVEAAEPWCRDAKPVADIGLFTPEEFQDDRPGSTADARRQPVESMGAVRMLTELHHQFDVISSDRDLSAYKLLILPDDIPVDKPLAKKLRQFVQRGGSLLASHKSGLTLAGDATGAEVLGVEHMGDAEYSPDFIVPGRELRDGFDADAYVMYLRGSAVKPARGARVLAKIQQPYFNRTWRHFCSHAHSPSSGKVAPYPAIVESTHGKGRCIYFAHPVFSQYQDNAPRWCKQLVACAIDRLMPARSVRTSGPSTLIAALNHQPGRRRYVLHLLHYIPERRGTKFDTIEDVIALHDLRCEVAVKQTIKAVRVAPQGQTLDAGEVNGRIAFTLATLNGHAMIELAY